MPTRWRLHKKVQCGPFCIVIPVAVALLHSIVLLRWAHTYHPKIESQSIDISLKDPLSRLDREQQVCLTAECIRTVALDLAQPFPDRQTPPLEWCTSRYDNSTNALESTDSTIRGLILIKVPKAASSTSAGIALRIS